MNIISRICPIHVAAIVFPTICVFGSQYFGAGAQNTFASDTGSDKIEFSQSQFEFELSSSEQFKEREVNSPFYFERFDFDDNEYVEDELDPNPYQNSDPDDFAEEIVVSAILPSAKNPLAIIDGKPRRVGDTLDSGWTVMAIHGEDFSVSMRHKSGKTARVVMKKVP
jgi:hypothetical protein